MDMCNNFLLNHVFHVGVLDRSDSLTECAKLLFLFRNKKNEFKRTSPRGTDYTVASPLLFIRSLGKICQPTNIWVSL